MTTKDLLVAMIQSRTRSIARGEIDPAYWGWLDLQGTDLQGVDLQDADLRDACLLGADLRDTSLLGANLLGADLLCANLQGATLDYACWPLWCGSKGVKVDRKIAAQLAAHFCALTCDDPDYLDAREAILDFAASSHVAGWLGVEAREEEENK